MNKNAGFTLIELLVVVLIISILAALALPQYQKAVAKARIARVLPVLKDIQEAEERFYMANGYYTTDKTLLDIEIKDNTLGLYQNKVMCYPVSGVSISRTWQHVGGYNDANAPAPGKFFCNGYGSNMGKEICRSFGSQYYSWMPHFTYW